MSDILGILFLGFAYGTTTCSVTCLPYLAPYLLMARRGFSEGVASSLAYLAGKSATYAVLGGIAAASGQVLSPGPDSVVRLLQGSILVLSGLALPFLSHGPCPRKAQTYGRNTSLFTLGVSTSLVPCIPVSSMLLAASQTGSVFQGLVFGLLYGAAIALSPLLLGSGAIALIGRTTQAEARNFVPWLRGLSMATLMLMGIRILI